MLGRELRPHIDFRAYAYVGAKHRPQVVSAGQLGFGSIRKSAGYGAFGLIPKFTHKLVWILIVFQLTFSKPTLLEIMLSDASSWITRSALTANGRRSKGSYVPSESEDIDLK
jgi:hypothetical protein